MTLNKVSSQQPGLLRRAMSHCLPSLDNYLTNCQPNPKRQVVVFHSNVREGILAASCYQDTLETTARLTEFGIPHSVVGEPSTLKRIIQNDSKPATLILPGGYTPLMARVLKEVYPIMQQRTQTPQNNTLNIWGHCAGGNILCQQFDTCRTPVETAKIVPLRASADVFPVEPKDPKYGDTRNRRVIEVNLPYSSNERVSCKVFWYRGSRFERLSMPSKMLTIPLALYDTNRVAEYLCLDPDSGSAIVVSGLHPLVVSTRDEIGIPNNPNAELSLGADVQRQLHVQYILKCLDMVRPTQSFFRSSNRADPFLRRSQSPAGGVPLTAAIIK